MRMKQQNHTLMSTQFMASKIMTSKNITENTLMKYLLLGLPVAALLIMSLNPSSVMAETANDSMPDMDHSKMDMSGSKDSGMDGMSGMGQGGMGDMQMQGGSAPADARDPHAYSGGQTLTSGDYALPGPRILKLADEHNFYALLFDRLERINTPGTNGTAYDMTAWFGRDYSRLVVKSEGDFASGKLEESSTDVMWSRAIATYWDAQLGMRYDSTANLSSRSWLAAGVQGLAPYWFEIDATAYVGNDNRTALALKAEYELLITQKLVLQPAIEANLYGKDDLATDKGKGLSDVKMGVRLRYEIKREFAPYVGLEYVSKYGNTAGIARAAGSAVSDTRLVAGLRFWY